LLADFVPFDPAILELAMRQFLDQIENLGGELPGFLAGLGLSPWLLAAVVATTASEIARRRLRQTQAGRCPATGGEGATATWFPDLAVP
jgi:hypothetical protein